MTDLDRLEKVRSGQLTGRGVGKTYASCYTALEFIRDNPDGVVFWLLPKWSWADYIRKEFESLFEEFGFTEIRRNRDTIYIKSAKIIFTTINTRNNLDSEVREITRGYRLVCIIYDSIFSEKGYDQWIP